MINNYLINPFIRIAGFKSLIIGFIGLIILSFASFKTGTHFNGLSNIGFAKDSNFIVYALEHIINWGVISVIMFLSAIFLSKSKVRMIDFIGTSLLARIPLIIAPVFRFIPNFRSFIIQSFEMYFIIGIYLLSLIWTIVLLFNGFKISSNLKNDRLVITFIIGLITSEIITRITIYSITFKL